MHDNSVQDLNLPGFDRKHAGAVEVCLGDLDRRSFRMAAAVLLGCFSLVATSFDQIH
jgi:hypothetical protein